MTLISLVRSAESGFDIFGYLRLDTKQIALTELGSEDAMAPLIVMNVSQSGYSGGGAERVDSK